MGSEVHMEPALTPVPDSGSTCSNWCAACVDDAVRMLRVRLDAVSCVSDSQEYEKSFMLGLLLREEFRGVRLSGTAIELANDSNTGATQVGASEFLKLTYPTSDVISAIEATGLEFGQPVVIIGERGQGKSHLLAVLHHVLSSPDVAAEWLVNWGARLDQHALSQIKLRPKTLVISESVARQDFRFLWDILFDRHPLGGFVKGLWHGTKEDERTDVPGVDLLLRMFRHTPTAVVLDEFQTWFEGLTNTPEHPHRSWAFNFIQILSEIAKEYPELLLLLVSVRNGDTEAYQQIHRVNPRIIDFKGPRARKDRLHLILHRLFENRMNIPDQQIEGAVRVHVDEHLRILGVPAADHAGVRNSYLESWPFAPHLMSLLEDQVLVATQAQETRDLIRILADVFKSRVAANPPGTPSSASVITSADFRIDDERCGVAALLDSVSNQHHATLRKIAQRNLDAVRNALEDPDSQVPHVAEVISSLWVRSLACRSAGAEPSQLRLDITRHEAITDSAFSTELSSIEDNSFNVHREGSRLVFRDSENPQAKLLSHARNSRLFRNGEDKAHLLKLVRAFIGGSDDSVSKYHVIVLGPDWTARPWEYVPPEDQPGEWDHRIRYVVVPEKPYSLASEALGPWLVDHLLTMRNTVRFLLPKLDAPNMYFDPEVIILARSIFLANQWKGSEAVYKKLEEKYEGELKKLLESRFDHISIPERFNYRSPSSSTFRTQHHRGKLAELPKLLDDLVREQWYIHEHFEALVVAAAELSRSMGRLMDELQELRPEDFPCIAWLGERHMTDRMLRVCAEGKIAINCGGVCHLQRNETQDDASELKRMQREFSDAKQKLNDCILMSPIQDSTRFPKLPTPVPVPLIVEPVTRLVPRSSDHATSALNLLGQVETWGVVASTKMESLTIKAGKLTGQELIDILKKLPDGAKYGLSMNVVEIVGEEELAKTEATQ